MHHSRSFNEADSVGNNQMPLLIDVPLSYDNVHAQEEESLTNNSAQDMNIENMATAMANQDDEQEKSSLSFRADDVDEGILICLSQKMMGHTSDNESADKQDSKSETKKAPEPIVVETVDDELEASELRASQQMDEIRANAVILLGRADEAHETDLLATHKDEAHDGANQQAKAEESEAVAKDAESKPDEAIVNEPKNPVELPDKPKAASSKRRSIFCRLLFGVVLVCFMGFGTIFFYEALPPRGLETFGSFQDEVVAPIQKNESESAMMLMMDSQLSLESCHVGDDTHQNSSMTSDLSLLEVVMEESLEIATSSEQGNINCSSAVLLGSVLICTVIMSIFAFSKSSVPKDQSANTMKKLDSFDALLHFQETFQPTGKGRKSKFLQQKMKYPMSYDKLTMNELSMILASLSPGLSPQFISRLPKLERINRINEAYCRLLLTLTKPQLHALLRCKNVSCKSYSAKPELLAAAAEAGFA